MLLALFKEVSLACGVHPLDLAEEPFDYQRLLRLAQDEKVVAIGEASWIIITALKIKLCSNLFLHNK